MQHADSNGRIVRAPVGVGSLGNHMYPGVDRTQDVGGIARTALFEVAADLIDITERLRSISNPHAMPRRLQNASTSSSETNGSRRAFSITSRSCSLKM